MSGGEFSPQRLYRIFSLVVIAISILSFVLFLCSFAKFIQAERDLKKIEKEWSESRFNMLVIEYLRLPVEKKEEVDRKKQEYVLRILMTEKGIPLWRTRMVIFSIVEFIFVIIFFGRKGICRYLVPYHPGTTNTDKKGDKESD